MEVVYKRLSEIRPYARNARHNYRTIEVLVDIIDKVGFNVPIVIDKKGVIVKGHARFVAAIRLGMEEVPCIISEADDEQNKLDRLADNLISEFSLWVTDDLLDELRGLNVDFDMGLLDLPNFKEVPTSDFDAPMGNPDAEGGKDTSPATESPETAPKRFYKVVCPECGHTTIVSVNDV